MLVVHVRTDEANEEKEREGGKEIEILWYLKETELEFKIS